MKKKIDHASSKIRVGILFGGKSAEHEVSLQSAKSIVEAMDTNKYTPVLIGIDKNGKWQLHDKSSYLLHSENPKLIALNKSARNVISFEPEGLLRALNGLGVSEGSQS